MRPAALDDPIASQGPHGWDPGIVQPVIEEEQIDGWIPVCSLVEANRIERNRIVPGPGRQRDWHGDRNWYVSTFQCHPGLRLYYRPARRTGIQGNVFS